MPIKQEVKNNLPNSEFNEKPKRNRYSIKKFLDRNRFSPRLLRLVKPSKLLDTGRPIPTNVTFTDRKDLDFIDKEESKHFPRSDVHEEVECENAKDEEADNEIEEEYEESLAHFTDRILDSVRTSAVAVDHPPLSSHAPITDSQMTETPSSMDYGINSGGTTTAAGSAVSPPVCRIHHAGLVGDLDYQPNGLACQLQQQTPVFSIYNEPCDAKPDFNMSGAPIPVYTSSGEVKLASGGDQIAFRPQSHELVNRRDIRSPLPSLPTEGRLVKTLRGATASPEQPHGQQQPSTRTTPSSVGTTDCSGEREVAVVMTTNVGDHASNRSISSASPLDSPSTRPTTVTGSTGQLSSFVDVPRGNTVIVHHASSPFARVPRQSVSPQLSNVEPVVRGKSDASAKTSLVHTKWQDKRTSPRTKADKITDESHDDIATSEVQCLADNHRSSVERNRSEPPPTYEEAWDLKMARQLGFGIDRLTGCTRVSSPPPLADLRKSPCVFESTGVQQFSGVTVSSPPPPPPHGTNSHRPLSPTSKSPDRHFSSQNVAKRTGGSTLRFHENRLFEKGKSDSPLGTVTEASPSGEYDYAYNGSWSMGVQLNLDLSLSGQPDSDTVTATPDATKSVTNKSSPLAASTNTCHSQYMASTDHRSPRYTSRLPNQSGRGRSTTSLHSKNGNSTARCSGVDGEFRSHSTNSYHEAVPDNSHGRSMCEIIGTRVNEPVTTVVSQNLHGRQHGDTRSPQHRLSPSSSSHSSPGSSAMLVIPSQPDSVDGSRQQQALRGEPIIGSVASVTTDGIVSASRRQNELLPLEEQRWFHPFLTRAEAEDMLSLHPEGSFLVRTSETCPRDYSLSVKHKTYLHMKISRNSTGHFILGEYSQPYTSIPQMILHYAYTQVPVRGAESVTLLHPVCR